MLKKLKDSTIIKNFSFIASAHILEKGIMFLITIILARGLKTEGYGIYALAIAFTGLFGHLMDGGMNLFLMREAAKDDIDKKKLIGEVISIKVITGIAAVILINILAILFGYRGSPLICISIYSLSMLFLSFSNIFRGVAIAMHRADIEAISITVFRLLLLSFIGISLYLNINIPWIMTTHLIAAIVLVIFCYLVTKRLFFVPTFNFTYKEAVSVFREAIVFAVGAVMGEIFFNVDTVMLSKMDSFASVGAYNTAYKLFYSTVIFVNAITLVAYPKISNNWGKDNNYVHEIFKKMFVLVLISAVVIFFVCYISADYIIPLLFGSEYQGSIEIFKVLLWALPGLFLMHLTIRTLEGIGMQAFVAKTMMVSVLINIILNYILIKRFGALGAGAATAITSNMIAGIHIYYLKTKVGFL